MTYIIFDPFDHHEEVLGERGAEVLYHSSRSSEKTPEVDTANSTEVTQEVGSLAVANS